MPLLLICYVDADDLPFVHFFSLLKRNEPKKKQDKTMLPRTLQLHPRCFVGPALYFLGCNLCLSVVFKQALRNHNC